MKQRLFPTRIFLTSMAGRGFFLLWPFRRHRSLPQTPKKAAEPAPERADEAEDYRLRRQKKGPPGRNKPFSFAGPAQI